MTIDEGNGNINAAGWKAKAASITVSGNGDVIVNAAESIMVSGTGNGHVTNIGNGLLEKGSNIKSNGEINMKAMQ